MANCILESGDFSSRYKYNAQVVITKHDIVLAISVACQPVTSRVLINTMLMKLYSYMHSL